MVQSMSYIGYIPKPIRHNADLSPRDKLIYCEITSTLDDRGVCTKNNIYFSNVTGCTNATVSASMTKLRELDYIDVIIEKEENTQKFKKRYIILKAVSNLQGGGNANLQKAVSNTQGGVDAISGTSSEGGNAKAISNTGDAIIINNNIRYIYSNKRHQIKYNENITQGQMEYLKKIVTDFYTAKHKQFPNHIKADWFDDNTLTVGSVNTLFDLITIDGWGEKEVRDVIKWATDDDFWSSNLLSLRTLRTKSKNGQTKFANLQIKYTN